MKLLRHFLDRQAPRFEKGGRWHGLYFLWEALDGFLYNQNHQTQGRVHVRDAVDLKRLMITVVWALVPAVLVGLYNVGYQANSILSGLSEIPGGSWQRTVMVWLGVPFDPGCMGANLLHGMLYFLPLYILTLAVGGFWEVLFACVRKHEINEGFLVTSLLFPLILPPGMPYWQAAIGISFGIVMGKEVFGGVGMNIWNPALVGRAFLFFAYPAAISGDKVWVAVDTVSQATPLALAAEGTLSNGPTWMQSFLGLIPGSMGETSTAAILLGAAILLFTGVASWRILVSVFGAMGVTAVLFNVVGSPTNPMFALSPQWHLVLGGFAFGAVFMATDPVSAAVTRTGQFLYGGLIGFLVVLIRVINPAFPEGMMLAILFGNTFSPIFDRLVIQRHIARRKKRLGFIASPLD